MDAEFKGYHLVIVDLLQEEEELEGEQVILDDDDDKLAGLFDRLVYLNTPVECEVQAKQDPQQQLLKRLQHVKRNIRKVAAVVSTVDDGPDVDRCLLEQYDEQTNRFN